MSRNTQVTGLDGNQYNSKEKSQRSGHRPEGNCQMETNYQLNPGSIPFP